MTSSSDIFHHYDAAASPRGVLSHAAAVWSYPRQILQSRVLVWNFFRRALLGRFRGSFGGVLWVLVQPVFQFLVYFMVFGVLFADPRSLAETGPDPTLAFYLFSGVLLFGTIQDSASQGMGCVISNANLVKKVAFPCELLPLTPSMVAVVVYAVGCVLLMVLGLLSGHTALTPTFLLWPVLTLCLLLFSTGVGLILGAANVFVRDISQLWPLAALAWFFGSPVFWRVSLVEDKAVGLGVPWIMDLLLINPAYSLLVLQRHVFGIGHALDAETYRQWFYHSTSTCLAVAVAWSVVFFLVGYGFFMSRKHKFADLV